MHHPYANVNSRRMWRRLNWTGYRSLELPGPGAVAHMSLHQKPTMSKSHQHHRRTVMAPRFVTGGPTVRSVLATEANRASRNRQGRVGEGPYMEALDSGQPPFCNFISRLRETPGNPWFYVGYRPRFASSGLGEDRPRPDDFYSPSSFRIASRRLCASGLESLRGCGKSTWKVV